MSSLANEVPRAGFRDVVGAYIALTKPRIIELLLITTIPAMFLAAGGVPPLWLAVWTMIGGTLAAGSANTFNCVLDRDIDQMMRRTRRRPMARHQVSMLSATVFGAVLAVLSTVVLWWGANLLSAALALIANAFYIFVYTLGLKRRTAQNIVWGGIAGCFPPLIGWTAVTNSVSWTPIILFAIVFMWTPPHTWALAFRYREDYKQAHVPMLPVVKPAPQVALQILIFSVLTAVVAMLLWPVGRTGWLYPLIAGVSGIALVTESVALYRRALRGLIDLELKPMRLFHLSNTYLALVFVAAALDPMFF